MSERGLNAVSLCPLSRYDTIKYDKIRYEIRLLQFKT